MMRISIGDDNVNFKPVEVNSLQDFVNLATKHNYSTGIFKNNYRNKANFIEAECIALDVDNEDPQDNYTIDGAKQLFADYKHIIMPSKSHQKDKNGRVADRFRVILFLERPITDAKDFTATWGQLLKFYPAADKACKDASRFYYPSPQAYSVNEQGSSWPVTQYVPPEPVKQELIKNYNLGQLSRSTLNFLTYGAPIGKRNGRLFKAAKDMQEQGFSIEECKARVANMISITGNWETNYLNETDVQAIENAYKNEPLYEPRESEVIRKSVFNMQTLSEMEESAGDVAWLAEDLIPLAGFTILSGPPKKGKSALIHGLIKETLEGGEFLGRKMTKGKVVLMSFEEQRRRLSKKLRLAKINPKDQDLLVHVGDVFGDSIMEDLEDILLDFQPKLVILDTLFAMINIESINNYKEVYDALKIVRDLSRKTGAAIIGTHHTNKTGHFMGSQAIYGVPDEKINFIAHNDKRFLYSSGKDGVQFSDQEIVYNPLTQTYTLGKQREKRKVDLL